MKVTRKIELDYGHTLPNEKGFCSQIHGHRATVLATVEGEIEETEGHPDQGMVLNFKELKAAMKEKVHDVIDHGFAVWKEDKDDREFIEDRNEKVLVTTHPPTAEYLAKWSYEQIQPELPEEVELVKVVWKETPNSEAIYQGDRDE